MIALLLAGNLACLVGPESAPWKLQFSRPQDTGSVEQVGDITRVSIVSCTGIGRLTLTPPEAADFPAQMVVRLLYENGKEFTTLEGLTVTTSRWQLRGSSRQSGKVPLFLADKSGAFAQDDLDPAGWINVRIVRAGAGLELQFPARLLQHERRLELDWIDFYRQ